jgi:hypothetical protein
MIKAVPRGLVLVPDDRAETEYAARIKETLTREVLDEPRPTTKPAQRTRKLDVRTQRLARRRPRPGGAGCRDHRLDDRKRACEPRAQETAQQADRGACRRTPPSGR